MNNKLYAISIITGQIFTIEKEDIKLLYNYQIPLKSKPNHRCKRCYGRGYSSIDTKNGLHHLCSCISKCLMDDYKLSQLPRAKASGLAVSNVVKNSI